MANSGVYYARLRLNVPGGWVGSPEYSVRDTAGRMHVMTAAVACFVA